MGFTCEICEVFKNDVFKNNVPTWIRQNDPPQNAGACCSSDDAEVDAEEVWPEVEPRARRHVESAHRQAAAVPDWRVVRRPPGGREGGPRQVTVRTHPQPVTRSTTHTPLARACSLVPSLVKKRLV